MEILGNIRLLTITDNINGFFDMLFGKIPEYESITVQSGGLASIRILITGIFLGVIIASLVMIYNKRVLGGAVRELISLGCVGEENAKPMSELKCAKNLLVRMSLTRGTTLRRVVSVAADESAPADTQATSDTDKKSKSKMDKIDIRTAKFYIPETDLEAASEKFDKKGTSAAAFVIVFAVSVVLYVLVMRFLPGILTIIDNVVSNF